MKNATIKFLLPNAFPVSKTGFYKMKFKLQK